MVAKGGHRLLLSEAEAALRDTLLPMAALLTPNLPEAEVLVGFPVRDRGRHAARRRAAGRARRQGGADEGRPSRGRSRRRPAVPRRQVRPLRGCPHREPQHPRHGLHAGLGHRRRPRPEDDACAMPSPARATMCARPSRPRPASAAAMARSITPSTVRSGRRPRRPAARPSTCRPPTMTMKFQSSRLNASGSSRFTAWPVLANIARPALGSTRFR